MTRFTPRCRHRRRHHCYRRPLSSSWPTASFCKVRRDYGGAEGLYQRAMALDPRHANSCYNYAVMLDAGLGAHARAEELYRRALETNPRHAYALYNLAVLVEESRRGDAAAIPEVRELFERAVRAAPEDALALSDYGRFLVVVDKNYQLAETILKVRPRASRVPNPRAHVRACAYARVRGVIGPEGERTEGRNGGRE